MLKPLQVGQGEDTFPAELWQAGEAWVSGAYTRTPLVTNQDMRQVVLAGKNFWIPADGMWVKYYGKIIFHIIIVYLFLMGFPLILFFGTNDVWWANVLWTIVIVSCIVCAIGARFYRWLYHRQFLAIGPNGVLFRKLGTATFFRWSDLARIEQVWVEWQHHKPDTLDEDIPSHFKDQIQCTFHSGNTIMLSKTRDTRLNRDEVISFEMFMALVLAYWKRANRTSFRGAEISMAEVEALMELEQVTGQTFKSMETPQSDTALSFTATGGHVRGVIMVQCGLETLPESIEQLSHLVELHLDHNLIQTLPATIGYLSSLAELHLQNNPITALPESIGQLQSLRRLYLNEGVISALSGAGEL